MAQQRETITNSLASLIQVIQLGRKSGVLTVERGEGATFEEGMITFVNGEAVEAKTTFFNGQNAFRLLRIWETCRYAFIPTPTSEVPAISAPINTSSFDQGMTDTGTHPRIPTSPLGESAATHPRIPTSPLRESAARRQASNGNTEPVISLMPASAVPHPIKSLEESLHRLEQLGLSRQHRHLLLLVDGQRTIAEMVRLKGLAQNEVQKLLGDLEQAGIIQS
ncbi:MAG TPA: DUF4388 domain-containing protein [Ktedonobacteraceae bacterium]